MSIRSLFPVLLLTAACGSESEIQEIQLDHYLTTCDTAEAAGVTSCSLADAVDGFRYEWGTRYELTVRYTPPPDGYFDHPGDWELVSIDRQEPVAPKTEFETKVTTPSYWASTIAVDGDQGVLFPDSSLAKEFVCEPAAVCDQILEQSQSNDWLAIEARHGSDLDFPLIVTGSEPSGP